MPPYRVAHLSPEQMGALHDLESEMGVALVAYEPLSEEERGNITSTIDEEDLVLDGLLDTYRTYDPQLII